MPSSNTDILNFPKCLQFFTDVLLYSNGSSVIWFALLFWHESSKYAWQRSIDEGRAGPKSSCLIPSKKNCWRAITAWRLKNWNTFENTMAWKGWLVQYIFLAVHHPSLCGQSVSSCLCTNSMYFYLKFLVVGTCGNHERRRNPAESGFLDVPFSLLKGRGPSFFLLHPAPFWGSEDVIDKIVMEPLKFQAEEWVDVKQLLYAYAAYDFMYNISYDSLWRYLHERSGRCIFCLTQ